MEKEQKEHHVFRLLYMILFWIFLRVSLVVTGLISFIQWVILWFQDEPISSLLSFGSSLKKFQTQILAFLTFETEDKVFPFSDWPEADPLAPTETPDVVSETESAGKDD